MTAAPTTDPPRPGSVIAAATLLFITAGLFGFAGSVMAMLSAAFGGAGTGSALLYFAVTGLAIATGVRLLTGTSWARTAANVLAGVLLVATGIRLANGGYTSLIVGIPGLFMQTAVLCCVNVRSARRYLTN
ncbi:hypothetical protein [Virgisporangium aurantiacum]|uniref:Uncharacterized protein n=1 Tax=Virgisporangium aurantiacum TaxID=175570 RepID=A0A8J3YZ59_9ACTN|nr:hypothetical protein [Virgisporangium aurantiacum]GIJ54359.1 hypothetical protein Vau01_018750 [Virgisporangium aurantiacum]